MNFNYEIEILLTKLKKELDFVNEELDRLPAGRLLASKRGEKTEFFHEYYRNGKRVRKKLGENDPFTAMLARKQYLIIKEKLMQDNLRAAESMCGRLHNVQHRDITGQLPVRMQNMPEYMFFDYDDWERQEYFKSSYLPEERRHMTSRGLRVRSKSELLLAEKFYEYRIRFRYEEVMPIGRHTVVPDFTIMRSDGKKFYWEHCGRTADRQYMDHHRWKISLYEGISIVPWDNLIVTYDDESGCINLAAAEGEIKAKLLI